MSLNLLQAGDTESSESRLLIVSGIMGIWALTVEGVGKGGTEQDPQSRGPPATVHLALRVLQGEPGTGANWYQ